MARRGTRPRPIPLPDMLLILSGCRRLHGRFGLFPRVHHALRLSATSAVRCTSFKFRMCRSAATQIRMRTLHFRSYVICTSPRSGSTLLCGLLAETGMAGRPDSHFHEPSLDRWLECHGLSDRRFTSDEDARRAVFASIRDKGDGGTGVFGLRLQQGSRDYFLEQVDRLYPGRSNDVERIEAAFGPTLFIYLKRTDRLAQAVSRVMAEQTGLWHRNADGSELERLAPPREPSYERKSIERHMTALAAMDADWERWFAREHPAPLRVDYEDLARAPQATLARLLEALGLDPIHASRVQPPTAKLAGAESGEWIERFTREMAT